MTQSPARQTTYVVTAAPRQYHWYALTDYKDFTVPLQDYCPLSLIRLRSRKTITYHPKHADNMIPTYRHRCKNNKKDQIEHCSSLCWHSVWISLLLSNNNNTYSDHSILPKRQSRYCHTSRSHQRKCTHPVAVLSGSAGFSVWEYSVSDFLAGTWIFCK